MNSFRTFNRRAGSIFAAAAIVFASVLPNIAAAAVVTERSVELSSSVKAATNVRYKVNFTAATANTGAFVLEFCDAPTINTTCTVPAGFSTSGAASSGGNTATAINSNKAIKVELGSVAGAGGTVTVDVTGITNPTDAGPFYGRIVTYTDDTALTANYVDADTLGTYKDDGSVAISITDGFGVSGAVLESLVFCAARATDTIGTGCTGTLNTPNVSLGTNGVLDTALSEGTVKTQISTNAAGGAVVSLKSNATQCGGLVRAGVSNTVGCGITPVVTAPAAIGTGAAKFGLRLVGTGAATGAVSAVAPYEGTNFFMNYVSGDGSGVTGPYGDPIYNTGSAPVNDGTANLTFGANISNVTPAGNYSAAFSLIATGKF